MALSTAGVRFPAPIGGIPMDRDFAPSILFACLYGVLTFLGFYRMAKRDSRSLFVATSLAFTIERVVIWSLRAKQAKTPSEDFNRNLLIYWQITFSVGYMSIHGKLVSLLRCLVVKTTKGIVLPAEQSDSPGGENLGDKPQVTDVVSPAISLEQEDQPKKRALYRRMFGLLALQSIVPFVIGTVGGNGYPDAVISAGAASIIQILRYVTTGVIVGLMLIFHGLAAWAMFKIPRIARDAVLVVVVLESILAIIPIYQLVIMSNWTTSLTSTLPGSQNSPGDKAAFYVLQAVPEFIVSAVLLVVNMKSMFETGNFGDRISDPKPKRSASGSGTSGPELRV